MSSLRTTEITVNVAKSLGPLPPMQGLLSQGTEASDPMFYAEMEEELAALRPVLLRVDPAAAVGFALDASGSLDLDFGRADRIMESLAETGTDICWNNATWPKEWKGENGYPANLDHYAEFTNRFVRRYNKEGAHLIRYVEFWNEPASFNRDAYAAMARGAKEADPKVKVGGPAVLDLKMPAIRKILEARDNGVPVDFVSYHLYHRAPWDYPQDARKVLDELRKFPGAEDLECLVTEWGIDMGESGMCDTRYDAVYYLTSLQNWMTLYPQVLPCAFEVRDGWDGKGPSRELWGRWGMLTYPHLLKKPIYQAARMWAEMAGERVEVRYGNGRTDDYDPDSDPDPEKNGNGVHVIASRDDSRMTVLVWSFPEEYARAKIGDPVHGASLMDTPFQLSIQNLPFESGGLRIERYVLDEERSNINYHFSKNELEKVQDQLVSRGRVSEALALNGVLGMHSIHLWVLRPAERPPVNVTVTPDKTNLWAGESAMLTIGPRGGEKFAIEYVPDPSGSKDWNVAVESETPLTLRVTPKRVRYSTRQYFSAWVRRPDWGASGEIFAEFSVKSPVEIVNLPWRVDELPVKPVRLPVTVRNIAGEVMQASVTFPGRPGTASACAIPAQATSVLQFELPNTGQEPGSRKMHGVLQVNGVALRDFEIRVDTPLVAAHLNDTPTIDGDLAEWSSFPGYTITGRQNWSGLPGSVWDGPEDLEATVHSGWDDECLYLAIEVRDATHIAREANNRMHQWDSLQLGFDLRRDATDSTLYYADDDCEYLFNLTDKANAYRQWGARRSEGVPENVRVAAKRVGYRTNYEIAIPWESEFSPYAAPVAGTLMGFSLYVRDYDGDPGETEAGHLMFGRGLDWHRKRPALFGSLFLAH